METFSLLQTSLDQVIDRRALEDASVVVPSVARADCARLQRELFGIVVNGLPHQEAIAFQAELARRDFPTEVVADRELPVLHESFQIQRIERRGEVLVLTDSMGRERARPLTDLVFLAAGFLNCVEFKTEVDYHFDYNPRGKSFPKWVRESEFRGKPALRFRVDFFLWASPNRMHANLGEETAIFHEGRALRLRDDESLRKLLVAMASLLPAERLNSCLREPGIKRIYPNLQCYEEEIRWHFRRLKPPA